MLSCCMLVRHDHNLNHQRYIRFLFWHCCCEHSHLFWNRNSWCRMLPWPSAASLLLLLKALKYTVHYMYCTSAPPEDQTSQVGVICHDYHICWVGAKVSRWHICLLNFPCFLAKQYHSLGRITVKTEPSMSILILDVSTLAGTVIERAKLDDDTDEQRHTCINKRETFVHVHHQTTVLSQQYVLIKQNIISVQAKASESEVASLLFDYCCAAVRIYMYTIVVGTLHT